MVATVPCVLKEISRTVGSLAVVGLIAGGCSAGTETPASSTSVVSSTTTVASSSRAIFLVVNGPLEFTLEKVIVTDQVLASDLTDQVRRALSSLIDFTGTTLDDYNREKGTSLGTSVPRGININSVDITDGVVLLDLDDAILLTSGSSSQEMMFAQQLAHTALLDSSLTELRVLVNGEPVSELWGHIDWSLPITADLALLK